MEEVVPVCPSCNGELQTHEEVAIGLCEDCVERLGVNYEERFSNDTITEDFFWAKDEILEKGKEN